MSLLLPWSDRSGSRHRLLAAARSAHSSQGYAHARSMLPPHVLIPAHVLAQSASATTTSTCTAIICSDMTLPQNVELRKRVLSQAASASCRAWCVACITLTCAMSHAQCRMHNVACLMQFISCHFLLYCMRLARPAVRHICRAWRPSTRWLGEAAAHVGDARALLERA